MDPFSFAPIAAILDAAYLGILTISDLFAPLAGGASGALAIVAVTLVSGVWTQVERSLLKRRY